MTSVVSDLPAFSELGLLEPVLKAVNELGYETPTPIQARTIPHMLAGRDVLGQAQTGTGKTAAFALPLLSRMDLKLPRVQVLVLVPTRELAIQVAEAFTRYAVHQTGLQVLSVYGGQGYGDQLRMLKRGVQVIVGTPGRVMDHMRRGTLDLTGLQCLVLDEADEMLRMGFIDDVEWILEQTPSQRQIALFSATMPAQVKRIAQRHLKNPEEISIKLRTTTAETIRQRYWRVAGASKLDALTRILETADYDGVIIFVRTKTETLDLAQALESRGYPASPLNGDIPQNLREQTIAKLKSGQLNILVATDVAARGLDVERISHVINYDIPYDTEAYVHRIGRTGRAGRSGEAILFVAQREARLLQAIERATRQHIEPMELPSVDEVNAKRIQRFKQRVGEVMDKEGMEFFRKLLAEYAEEKNLSALDLAAAMAVLLNGGEPFLLKPSRPEPARISERAGFDDNNRDRPRRPARADFSITDRPAFSSKRRDRSEQAGTGDLETFRVEVGRNHGVKPANLVGAIANETGLDSKFIGRIEIQDEYSTVDLPAGIPNDTFATLKKIWVVGRQLNISRPGGSASPSTRFTPEPEPSKRPMAETENKPKIPRKPVGERKAKPVAGVDKPPARAVAKTSAARSEKRKTIGLAKTGKGNK